ncbi:putative outer membrane domain protein, partial [Vibrio parahaemolyticus V-223/04]
RSID